MNIDIELILRLLSMNIDTTAKLRAQPTLVIMVTTETGSTGPGGIGGKVSEGG